MLKGLVSVQKMSEPVRRAWATSSTTCDVASYCTELLTHVLKYVPGHKPNKRLACDAHAQQVAEAKGVRIEEQK